MKLKEKIEFLYEVMDYEGSELTPEQRLIDIDEWDSLSSLTLILEMKKLWKIDLKPETIKGFETIGDICNCIPD